MFERKMYLGPNAGTVEDPNDLIKERREAIARITQERLAQYGGRIAVVPELEPATAHVRTLEDIEPTPVQQS